MLFRSRFLNIRAESDHVNCVLEDSPITHQQPSEASHEVEVDGHRWTLDRAGVARELVNSALNGLWFGGTMVWVYTTGTTLACYLTFDLDDDTPALLWEPSE